MEAGIGEGIWVGATTHSGLAGYLRNPNDCGDHIVNHRILKEGNISNLVFTGMMIRRRNQKGKRACKRTHE